MTQSRGPNAECLTIDRDHTALSIHRFGFSIGEIIHLLQVMREVARERRHLAALSNDQLRDIGVNRHAANQESNRSILDLPQQRKSEYRS